MLQQSKHNTYHKIKNLNKTQSTSGKEELTWDWKIEKRDDHGLSMSKEICIRIVLSNSVVTEKKKEIEGEVYENWNNKLKSLWTVGQVMDLKSKMWEKAQMKHSLEGKSS